MNTILTTLNAKYIHTNLALRYLKGAASPEFNPIIAEYTIKDPAFNIVSDLFQKNLISLDLAVIFGILKKQFMLLKC